jgi:nickel-dependent lactate racemase
MKMLKLPQLTTNRIQMLELPLADGWRVEIFPMAGQDRPALKLKDIRAALARPIDAPPLRELARGRKEVAIIFDDQTRLTRVAQIAPLVIEALAAGGIRIRFVCGLGLHGTMNRPNLVQKLGENILSRFPVYNHNAFGNYVYVGTTTTYQTKVYINEEVMKCDFKIAIGSVVPHHLAGFGGGGKIIMPGVAAYETIQHNHMMGHSSRQQHPEKPEVAMAQFDHNPLRRDIDETARLVGMDFLINCLLNGRGETTAVFAGEMTATHTAAVQAARQHYLTRRTVEKDIVIANTSSPNNVTSIGTIIAFPAISRKGGDAVLIASYPEGRVPHYLSGRWGKDTWAAQHRRLVIPKHVNRLLVYDQYPHPGSRWFDEYEKITYHSRWQDILQILEDAHGHEAKVAVYPNAEIQYSA